MLGYRNYKDFAPKELVQVSLGENFLQDPRSTASINRGSICCCSVFGGLWNRQGFILRRHLGWTNRIIYETDIGSLDG